MLRLDRYVRILAAVLDERDAPLGAERGADLGERRRGLGELVVDVDHQNEVDLVAWELRVALGREDRHDVREVRLRDAGTKEIEHLRLEIGREDASARADALRDAHREVARAGAYVGDGHAFLHAEHVEHVLGLLGRLAVRAVEPVGALVAHGRRECSPHVSARRVGCNGARARGSARVAGARRTRTRREREDRARGDSNDEPRRGP